MQLENGTLVTAVYHHVGANEEPVIVKVHGLRAEACYRMKLNMEDMDTLQEDRRRRFVEQLPYGYKEGERITGAAVRTGNPGCSEKHI